MKLAVAAALSLCFSTAAFAADPATPATTAAPAATAAKFSTATPIEQLAANPAAAAVLEANFPKITQHPMYDSFKAMSLKDVAPMSGGKITDAQLTKAEADLAAIK
jgi:hypothetical protein